MHGGDIYGKKINMDFSVNINPLGPPDSVLEAIRNAAERVDNYPDLKLRRLRAHLAAKTRISADNILCGNGASELIMALMNGVNPERVYLIPPCFTGYENSLRGRDTELSWLVDKDGRGLLDLIKKEVASGPLIDRKKDNIRQDILIITNPNNPDGRAYSREEIKELADILKSRDIILVIDECFINLSDAPGEYSFIEYLREYENVIILGAFTKSFAIPGVRLGYMLFQSTKLRDAVRNKLPEWNVSVIAEEAGLAALGEDEYLKEAGRLIRREREYLEKSLTELGFRTFLSKANFLMFRDESEQADLFAELLKRGTLIRRCSDYYGLDDYTYRVAVRTHSENEKLIKQINEIRRIKV